MYNKDVMRVVTNTRKEVNMTNREFYQAVINEVANDELKTFAQDAIAKLDKRNENRSNKPSKTQIANEPIKKAITELLTDKPMSATEIAEKVEISTQKASALCRQLVNDGVAKVTDVKSNKRVVKGYAKA